MRRTVYLVAKHGFTIPGDADADLVVDDLIDVVRDNDTVVVSSAERATQVQASLEFKHKFVLTIEEIK